MEFAVGFSPARQLCAERSFVVSAAPAGRNKQGRGSSLLSFRFVCFLLLHHSCVLSTQPAHTASRVGSLRAFGMYRAVLVRQWSEAGFGMAQFSAQGVLGGV